MKISENHIISVIVPIYNTEQYLERCLESIVNQTYSHLEIICVNDASPGDARNIVSTFMEKDSRIKYIEHQKNKGLFAARVTGSEQATGEYIAFVDSDDYISIDFYRLLLDKAIVENADIVEGRIIREQEDKQKFIQHFNNILLEELTGDTIKEEFFSQEGLFYHWHVVWNKIYSKKLWDKCLPYFKKQTKHLIMTEDLVFSSLLFYNATKYCSIKYDGYFYYVRAEAATGSNADINKFLKAISDMAIAFDFVNLYLQNSGENENYINNLINWKRSYFRLWASRIETSSFSYSNKKRVLNELKQQFRFEGIKQVRSEDYFHSIMNIPWDPDYEELKQQISCNNIECISFDIFDTLVVRPFYDPSDLFYLLDDYFHEICPDCRFVEFSKLRIEAEKLAREQNGFRNPSWQDVNLDEIYMQLNNEYEFPIEVLNKLKAKEIELEIKFISKRDSVYELYKLARHLKKKIIFVSDMYLSKSSIERILKEAGYSYYDKLYVSSETRLLKHTGDMFKYVINDLGIMPNKILHIGDNWNSDILKAKENGWNTFFFAKTIDLLKNNLSNKHSGNSMKFFLEGNPSKWSSYEKLDYMGTRCMLAVVANKLFDNPFISFCAESDFNSDPYFIGYYALGMHTFGLSKWILEDANKKGIDKIHFIARDGYLPYQVYKIITSYQDTTPTADYIYASRKSLLPYLLTTKNIYGLESFVSIFAHSPKSILEMLKDYLKDDMDLEVIEKKGIILTKKFNSQYEFKKFIDILIQYGIDYEKVENYKEILLQYYNSRIGSNDATFDLGYSARLQTIIVNIIQRRCDTYFVHTNKETPWRYSHRNNFEINSFYEFKPNISGILREHLFAELGPSCIGFEKSESSGDINPVFEEYCDNPINKLIVSTLQKGTIDFTQDIMQLFNEHYDILKLRNNEVSVPLECFLHFSNSVDRMIFKHSSADDTVHSANDKNSVLGWWNTETSRLKINASGTILTSTNNINEIDFLFNRSKFVKACFYALFDRNTLKSKVKARYSNKPIILKPLSVTYRSMRKIKRIFKPV
ncbi:HAD-IA family hydrolase [Paenibacillus motobuensis]|uniref:HAD-IA family hydrolase n=1 Tax=Paenibacillus motobuensis TaxID=295324 RepID=A0ABN0Y022_9BACL